MKKEYKKAEFKVVLLSNCIITTSGNDPIDDPTQEETNPDHLPDGNL